MYRGDGEILEETSDEAEHPLTFTSFGAPLPMALLFIPHVVASPQFASFPSIPFKDFSDFILGNFGPTISLSTVINNTFTVNDQ